MMLYRILKNLLRWGHGADLEQLTCICYTCTKDTGNIKLFFAASINVNL